MNRSTVVVLALLLQGCAYQAAMKRGDAHAAANAWIDAWEAYDFAAEVRATDDATRARDQAIDGQVAAAAAEAGAGRFEVAFGLLEAAEARAPEHPRVAAARDEAQAALVAALPARTGGTDVHEAYAFAASAKRWYPTSWEIENALRVIRDRVVADARARQKDGDWTGARAVAARLLDYEPEHRTLARGLDDEIVAAWVAEIEDQAKDVERARPGQAAVLYARAYEIGGRAEHLTNARSLFHDLAEAAPRKVFVDSDGTGPRHYRVRKDLATAVVALPGAAKGFQTTHDVQVKVFANTETCKETQAKERQSKEYVSGTRQVPNPEHAKLTAALQTATTEQKAAARELADAEKAHGAAAVKLAALDKDHAAAKTRHDAAAAALELSRTQHTKAQTTRDAAKAEVDRMTASGDVGLPGAQTALADATRVEQEWAAKREVDTKAEGSARAALEAVEAQRVPQQATVAELEKKLAAAKTRSETADKELATTEAALAKAPKTLTEDVKETLFYDRITWTNTCETLATVYFTPGWKTELEKKQKFTFTRSSTDTSQVGNEKAGVPEDPKAYPKSQKELVAELDAEELKAIGAATDAFLAEYFGKLVTDALGEVRDPGAATDDLVHALAGAPTRLTPDQRTAIAAAITKRHGLENLALVVEDTPVAPPTTVEAAPAPVPAPPPAPTLSPWTDPK